jgi:hypothetical protein
MRHPGVMMSPRRVPCAQVEATEAVLRAFMQRVAGCLFALSQLVFVEKTLTGDLDCKTVRAIWPLSLVPALTCVRAGQHRPDRSASFDRC